MKLYGYWRSSAAYRARIALAIKGLSFEYASVDLANGGQHRPDYAEINPQNLVPVLEDEGRLLYQSAAIVEYLEEKYPKPPLLPENAAERNRVRSLALLIACEIHPLNNPRVLNYLTGKLGISEQQKLDWYAHWVATGFKALERRLSSEPQTGRFSHGDTPTMADVFLVPQVANAVRFKVDLEAFPTIRRINSACGELEAFRKAAPENQPDAVK